VPPRPSGPSVIFLPVVLRDRPCPPTDLFTDVALVIDASTTMLEPLPGGRRKFEVAVDAARAFVDGMRLRESGPSDQISLVAFNSTSTTLAELSASPERLHRALDAFTPIRQQSRIELGVYTAFTNLVGPRHRPANRQVMVVISDGQANPTPGEEAVRAAAGAKDAGILVYVVGIGPSIDEAVLRAMATDASRYLFVPDANDLGAVFRSLAASKIPCAPEMYWPHTRR
jgi:Mg-chelatase subunit ChlD